MKMSFMKNQIKRLTKHCSSFVLPLREMLFSDLMQKLDVICLKENGNSNERLSCVHTFESRNKPIIWYDMVFFSV